MSSPWGPNTVAGIEDIIYSRIDGSSILAQYLGLTSASRVGSMLVPNSVQPVLVVNGETATGGAQATTTDFIHAGGHAFSPALKSGFEFIPGDPSGLGTIATSLLNYWGSSVTPQPISALFSNAPVQQTGAVIVRDVVISTDDDNTALANFYCGLTESSGSAPTIVDLNTFEAPKQALGENEGAARLILGNINSGGAAGGIQETPNGNSSMWISNTVTGMMYQRAHAEGWRPFEKVTPFLLPLNRKIVGGQAVNGATSSPGFGVAVIWQEVGLSGG